VTGDFRSISKSEFNSARETPAREVDVHTGKAVQFDPLGIPRCRMVLKFSEDDSGVDGQARTAECRHDGNKREGGMTKTHGLSGRRKVKCASEGWMDGPALFKIAAATTQTGEQTEATEDRHRRSRLGNGEEYLGVHRINDDGCAGMNREEAGIKSEAIVGQSPAVIEERVDAVVAERSAELGDLQRSIEREVPVDDRKVVDPTTGG